MSALTVYLHGHVVGTLEQENSGSLRFTYKPDWLANSLAIPLSRMLPLSPEPYGDRYVRPFFAGILPEAGPRTALARILGISEGNDFALLERIGGECAGAVSLLPEGQAPLQAENRTRVLDRAELVSIIHALPSRPLMAGEEGVRLSLAGAQDKLPVVIHGDDIAIPLGNTPSTHIIKPEPVHFPGLAANEVFCMELARRVGLDAARAEFRIVGDTPCVVVARYDRVAGGGGTVRLHQEDFCQALGHPPERKYQQEGGPAVRDCLDLLRHWSTTPVLDIRGFVDALIFNILIGNADAHGKNYSMIYTAGQRRLAPLYDLVSTMAWPELSTRLAMNIGNGKSVNDLNPAHFRRMSEDGDLGWPMIRDRIGILAGRTKAALEAVTATGLPLAGDTVHRLSGSIQGRCERMLQS